MSVESGVSTVRLSSVLSSSWRRDGATSSVLGMTQELLCARADCSTDCHHRITVSEEDPPGASAASQCASNHIKPFDPKAWRIEMSNYPGITSIFGTRLSTSSAFACSIRLHVIAFAGSPLPSLQPPLSSLMGSSRQSLAFVVVAFPKRAGYTHTQTI